jgi:transcriptional regulator with XRE-family HTH domain
MNSIFLNQKTPEEIIKNISKRLRERRRKMKLSQERLSVKSGVSLGSLKRFEATGEISLKSLTKIAIALGVEEELTDIFSKRTVESIEEIIDGYK